MTTPIPSHSLQPLPDPEAIRPGSWLPQARTAVAALAECTTLAEVSEHFGSARHLAEIVLGFPINGGHATKPMVRLLGELLHHPLGPAVAAEALAFAAEVQHLVPTTTIEALLREYVTVPSARGIPGRDELDDAVESIELEPRQRRHQMTLKCCAPLARFDAEIERLLARNTWSASSARAWHEYGPSFEVIHLRWAVESLNVLPTFAAPHDVEAILLQSQASPDVAHDQLALVAHTSPCEFYGQMLRLDLVTDPRFAWLTTYLGVHEWQLVLSYFENPAAFRSASSALRHGADLPPTLLVALMLMLPASNEHRRRRFISRRLVKHLARHSDRRVRLALATHILPGDLTTETVDSLAAELARATEDWYLLSALRSAVPAFAASAVGGLTRMGCRVDCSAVHCGASRVGLLLDTTAHRDDPSWVPFLAGISGSQRHRHAELSASSRGSRTPYHYPAAVRRLAGQKLPGHTDWAVRLPVNERELRMNAAEMGNCTAGYGRAIECGDEFVLIIDGPAGQACNVSIELYDGRWTVTESRARFNEPEPGWMADAVEQLLQRATAQRPSRRRPATSGTHRKPGRSRTRPPSRRRTPPPFPSRHAV